MNNAQKLIWTVFGFSLMVALFSGESDRYQIYYVLVFGIPLGYFLHYVWKDKK